MTDPTSNNASSPQLTPRRNFLRVGSLGLLGIGLSDCFRLSAAASTASENASPSTSAQSCILLFLEGGQSQIDSWDPKPQSGFNPISTRTPSVQISELYPRVAARLDKVALLRTLHTEENNHPQGVHYVMTGHRPSPRTTYPSLGSIISKELGFRNSMPPYVMVPQHYESDFFSYVDAFNSAFIGAQYNPVIVPDPSKGSFVVPDLSLPKTLSFDDIENRLRFLDVVDKTYRHYEKRAEFAQMDRFTRQAMTILLSPTVKQAFDLSQESEKTKDAYGRDRVGQSVLLARRLVEAGCRFVTADGYDGGAWDTHLDHDALQRSKLAPTLDRTLSTLLDDLDQRGLLDSTLVLAMGEFGRTPHLNAQKGRDHYPECWSMLMAGGGIQGGRVVGRSDTHGAQIARRRISMGDVFATIYKALGIDWTKTYVDPFGRPMYIANALDDAMGQPVTEVF